MSTNGNAGKRKYQNCVDRMENYEKKPEFHGSDLEKIADYYHLDREKIVLFGANVNPLGLSAQVKDLAEHLDIISSYPDRDYTDLKKQLLHIPIPRRNILLSEMVLRSLSHF